jgi:hypothetical protein
MGIVEEQWMATLSTLDFDQLDYESYILAGKRLAQQMRKEDVCEFLHYCSTGSYSVCAQTCDFQR